MPKRRIDIGVIIAITWLAAALWATLFFGGRLGIRGWSLLLLHHGICVPACTHELLRGWRRRKLAQTALQPEPEIQS